jgi:hypothetical protein
MFDAVEPAGGLNVAPALAVTVDAAVTLGLGWSDNAVVMVGGFGGGMTATVVRDGVDCTKPLLLAYDTINES